jgi:ATP-dependent Lon protease
MRNGGTPMKRRIEDCYDEAEADFFASQPRAVRRKIRNLEERISKYNDDDVPMRFKVLLSDLDDHVKAVAIKKITSMDERSGEHGKMVLWVGTLCRLPIGKYASIPVSIGSALEDIRQFITGVSKQLDDVVYGHTECKDHIMRLLCQWVTNPTARGMVIGIQGAAGVGKTCLVKHGICRALGLPFAFIPLGGASDGTFLEGHSYTYEGAVPGKMVDVLLRAKVMNPVLFFDETDKISATTRGQEVTNILIHLTDSSQNDRFTDRYFSDVPLDFSRSLMVFSFNDAASISPILLDRMAVIHVPGYTPPDKLKIATGYLLPELLKEYNLSADSVILDDALITHIISRTEAEEGVRNLKRSLERIISNVNLQRILHARELSPETPWKLTNKDVDAFIARASNASAHRHMSMYS